jgi:hypothetical protein
MRKDTIMLRLAYPDGRVWISHASWPVSSGAELRLGGDDENQDDTEHGPGASSTSDATSGSRSMPAFRSVQQSDHCAREEFLYELKAVLGRQDRHQPTEMLNLRQRPPGAQNDRVRSTTPIQPLTHFRTTHGY